MPAIGETTISSTVPLVYEIKHAIAADYVMFRAALCNAVEQTHCPRGFEPKRWL